MLETLKQDYIVNARAQGLTTFRIVAIYALRNAMLPTMAMIGLRFGWMLGGTVLVEAVFDWPGIGLYAVQAAISSDFEPIMGATIVLGFFFMMTNFLIDVVYGVLTARAPAGLSERERRRWKGRANAGSGRGERTQVMAGWSNGGEM